MSSLTALARPDIVELEPYAHAAWEPDLERLHANENPWRTPGDNSAIGLNRYPEPQPASLVRRLAALYGVDSERTLVGRGSDEAIDLLVRAFCRAEVDGVLVLPPTFGMYKVAAQIQGAKVEELVLTAADGFAPTAASVLARWQPHIRLVFLCTPNNPTGNAYDGEMVATIARELAGRALVVADEAYLEFSGRPSLANRKERLGNLVVLRTLSKAHALAGARCGCALADPEVIDILKRIIPPYAIPSATAQSVEHALLPPQLAMAGARVAMLVAERDKLAQRLARSAAVRRVFPSAANFLLVEFAQAGRAFEKMRAAGLLVRDVRRQPGLGSCLRITIGLPEQNERLVTALESP
ncbi:MAG TPA: histidinol-phosphate transaminase [Steroidobacteraceae bacterium]|nr:histidinol-phosphate transaminase [Steroidobacteraceae bacterium]